MGTRTEITRYDDLDASTDAITGHTFALDAISWEIDLSEANLDRLREALRPFTAAGRRLPAARATNRATARARTARPSTPKAVRRWWQDNTDRDDLPEFGANGPIPREVYQAYHDAHQPAGN